MKASLPILLLSLLFIGCGGSSTPAPPPPTVTGTWTGSATSAVDASVSGLTGKLTQGQTQPDGTILFSGTLNVSNSCLSPVTITNGQIAGGAFQLAGNTGDGGTLNISATINAADTNISGSYVTTPGNVCVGADHGSFTLTK